MKTHIILSLLLTAKLSAIPVFIGTGRNGDAKGIYRADFDPATGKLTDPKLAAEYASPGFLAQHPEKPVLLSIGAPKTPFPDGTSSVAAFAIGKDFSLTFLGEASAAGKGACHLAIDATGKTVAVANYGDGKISTIRLDENGVPKETVSVIVNTGSGPNPQRQEGPHAHGVYFDKANRHLFVPDLGLDKVLVYPFDANASKLGEALEPLGAAPGAGPRHMAFTPDEKHAYVINELDNTILAASYQNGSFRPIGVSKTLPADFTGRNTTAEIEVSADEKHVYASNRGHDSLAVFSRDAATGTLTFVQHAPCGGRTPRHFKISPCGKWLLCGHQDSNTLSILPRDPATGKLGEPAQTISTPSPICILFAR